MNQVPLSITDSHQRALAFHRITEGIADYMQQIDRAIVAGDRRALFQMHDELAALMSALDQQQGRTLEAVDELLKHLKEL